MQTLSIESNLELTIKSFLFPVETGLYAWILKLLTLIKYLPEIVYCFKSESQGIINQPL